MDKFSQKVEVFIARITPEFIKKFAVKSVNKLPPKYANWILQNKFLSICIIYTIRGLFFRPSMWVVYAAIASYFGFKD